MYYKYKQKYMKIMVSYKGWFGYPVKQSHKVDQLIENMI